MSIAKVTEIIAESPEGFDHAIKSGLERANKTLDGIQGAWIKDQTVTFKNGKVASFRVCMKVTFVLKQ
jgi:hypothetical protein